MNSYDKNLNQMQSNRNQKCGCSSKATNKLTKTAKITIITANSTRRLFEEITFENNGECNFYQNNKKICRRNSNKILDFKKIIKEKSLVLSLVIMTILSSYLLPKVSALPAGDLKDLLRSPPSLLNGIEDSEDSLESLNPHQLEQLLAFSEMIQRSRKRKRHSNYLYFHDHLHESDTELEWVNPCGGVFEPQHHQQQQDNDEERFSSSSMETLPSYSRPPVRQYLRLLRQMLRAEYRTLKEMPNVIDISNMGEWRLHQKQYKFLPKLKDTSKISLKRWYSNMQTFVAAFAYLGRTQYKWDKSRLNHASNKTHELNELLISARRILCEIETTINGSYPNSNGKKLTNFTREEMNGRLKLRTRYIEQMHGLTDPHFTDLLFVKHQYYDNLAKMWKILRKQGRRQPQATLHSGSLENSLAAVLNSDESLTINDNSLMQEDTISIGSESLEKISLNKKTKKNSAPKRHQRRQKKAQKKNVN